MKSDDGAGSRWSAGPWLLPVLAVFILVVAARYLGAMDRVISPTYDLRATGGVTSESFGDFRDTVWIPVRDLVAGGNPYDAPAYLARHPYAFEFTYAPAQLVLFAPLAMLPMSVAVVLWFGFLMVGAVALGLVTLLAVGAPRLVDRALGLAGAILLLLPMGNMINDGQTSIVAIIGTAVAVLRRRPDITTSVAVAAAWLKPQFGIPVVVILIASRMWRPAAWGTAIAAVVSLPAVVWASLNVGGFPSFLSSLPKAVDAALNSPSTRPTNGRVNPDLGSLLGQLTGDRSSGLLVVAALVVVLGLGTAAVARHAHSSGFGRLVATASGLLTVLLCLPHVGYDLVLVVPAVALAMVALFEPAKRWATATTATAVGAMVLILVPVGGTNFSLRELELTLAVLAVGTAAAFPLLPGTQGRRAGVIASIAAVLLVVRYVLVFPLEQWVLSGKLGAWMLLVAWSLLTATALMTERPERQPEPDLRPPPVPAAAAGGRHRRGG